VLAEAGSFGPLPLVRLADLGHAPHGHLRRDPEPLAELGVVHPLEHDRVTDPGLECLGLTAMEVYTGEVCQADREGNMRKV
jgi:hypothetical protein